EYYCWLHYSGGWVF
nr:immunoglobulin light chain junction region [Macaca mulatta]MOX78065.1 immunoglobulin light chain junction region [Macaca mulatta]MOY17274.1 immunoglobulin light chain junction region [Macaca mulatta]